MQAADLSTPTAWLQAAASGETALLGEVFLDGRGWRRGLFFRLFGAGSQDQGEAYNA